MSTTKEHVGRGAPMGNTNYRKGKLYQRALFRALEQKGKQLNADVLLKVCERAIDDAINGDRAARDHIADRIDGKPAQALTGPDGGPIQVQAVAITDSLLDKLNAEQLNAFRNALPALEVLGLVSLNTEGAVEDSGAETA